MLRSKGLRGSTSSQTLNVWRSALHILGRRELRETPRSTKNIGDAPPSERSEVGAIPVAMYVQLVPSPWPQRGCLQQKSLQPHPPVQPVLSKPSRRTLALLSKESMLQADIPSISWNPAFSVKRRSQFHRFQLRIPLSLVTDIIREKAACCLQAALQHVLVRTSVHHRKGGRRSAEQSGGTERFSIQHACRDDVSHGSTVHGCAGPSTTSRT